MASRLDHLSRPYVAWVRRRALAIVLVHIALLAGGLYLITHHLPLYADFSYLLPQDAPSVRDLRKLEARVKATETALVLVAAPSPERRAAAAAAVATGIRALPRDLVEQVVTDQAELRSFLEANRHLLVPLADLVSARDALADRIKQAKLDANPLFINLDDDTDAAAKEEAARVSKAQLDDLRARRKDAEARLARLDLISPDQLTAMIQVRTPFRGTDAGKGQRLIDGLARVRAAVVAADPGVSIGWAGGPVTAVSEHHAIADGMLVSSLVTGALVALVLVLYFRSLTLLALLFATLVTATILSFGVAALTVGHLNAATAFLGAIIAGNGINYGILLIARYLEERGRHGTDEAMAVAVVGTLKPTAVASLGAAIAYGSLAATRFRGFADFAVIGAIGMLLTWVASYLLLPALVLRWGRETRTRTGDPTIGSALVRVLGFRRPKIVLAVAVIATLGCSVVVYRYVAADPFEYDIKQLRSEGGPAIEARRWMAISDRTFGRGISGRTVIAADRLDQVPLIVEALHATNAGVPPAHQTIGEVWSVHAFVPTDQAQKLTVLAEIRTMLDDTADALDDTERTELMELRPPDALAPITLESLPRSLRERFTERDGRVGYLVEVRPAISLNEWNGHDLIRFATAVREIRLRDGETVTTSGGSVVFADIVTTIERDGPLVTGVAAIGLVIMVLLVVGRNRGSFAVLIGTAAGTLLMAAACALLGLKVNFLDFVALPITLGLGIDYAINVAHRQGDEDVADPLYALRTSGSAVFLCSLTTVIGYGSLLVSDNLAIRGFGTASLIGEVACVLTALVLVPAILSVGRRRGPAIPGSDVARA